MAALDSYPGIPLNGLPRRAVAAWRERHGMSARRFGDEASGDPDFVSAQARGRPVRLGTADRVLVFMGLALLGPGFRREVEAFLEVTGAKASVLGEEAAGPGINLEEEGGRGMNGNGSTRETASWLGLLPRTLDRYRVSGDGPGPGGRVMRRPSAKWPLLALAWAALIVFAVWASSGDGESGPAGGIEAELAGEGMAAARRVRRSEALIGELDAHLRRIEKENARLRARLVRHTEDSRTLIERQATAIDALTRMLEPPKDLPAGDVRPGAGAGGNKERARGGAMGHNEVPGR